MVLTITNNGDVYTVESDHGKTLGTFPLATDAVYFCEVMFKDRKATAVYWADGSALMGTLELLLDEKIARTEAKLRSYSASR